VKPADSRAWARVAQFKVIGSLDEHRRAVFMP
jgi:hypothetical protein